MERASLVGMQLKNALSGERAACLLGQLGAAVILIIAITVLPSDTTHWEYTIAVGTVAAFFALVGLVVQQIALAERVLFTAPVMGDVNVCGLLAVFLVVWWGIGTWVITIQGPFIATGNGYFATWTGFVSAIFGVGVTLPRLRESAKASMSSLFVLLICSIATGAELCLRSNGSFFPAAESTFGLCTVTLTAVVIVTIYVHEIDGNPLDVERRRPLFVAILLLWTIAAYWLTFSGPFVGTGNGYFSLWVGLLVMIKLTVRASTIEATYAKVAEANERYVSMVAQCACGVVLCIAVGYLDESEKAAFPGYWEYALSVGIVGAVFSFLAGLLVRNSERDTAKKKVLGVQTYSAYVAFFLFVWWAVGAGVITVEGPFKNTRAISANGYFSVWAGFGFSVFGLGLTKSHAKAASESGVATLIGLITCAVVEIVDLAPLIADQTATYKKYENQTLYALVVSSIVAFFVSLVLLARYKGKTLGLPWKVVSVSFFILLTIMASWITFTGPFSATGNGYYAAWLGTMCSLIIALSACFPQLFPTSPTAGGGPAGDVEEPPAVTEAEIKVDTSSSAEGHTSAPEAAKEEAKPAAAPRADE
ncbi:hypothetical protein AB1Y20_017953 [Prymnesium parvum]|uniref:Uncharacterized protein n=1 Tax=Prymnesium parvum TaxID=97485 RepID=A0AB34JLP6_PRYPA